MNIINYISPQGTWLVGAIEFPQDENVKTLIVETVLKDEGFRRYNPTEFNFQSHEEYEKTGYITMDTDRLEEIGKIIGKISKATNIKFSKYPTICTEKIPYVLVYEEKKSKNYIGKKARIYVLSAPIDHSEEDFRPYKPFEVEENKEVEAWQHQQ